MVTQSATRFADIYSSIESTGYAVANIGGNTCGIIGDSNSSLRPRNVVCVGDKRTCPTSHRRTSECASCRLMTRFECTFDQKVAYIFVPLV